MPMNVQVLLASRPAGWVEESNFRIVETPIPEPGSGQLLVKNVLKGANLGKQLVKLA